ncbi:MAG: hypothetical protein JW892_12690, partial [Anaerolineae bacterium]|nr:hypothetical protein [Anaerolineae bacterium]
MSITLEIRQHPITRGKYPITLTLHRPDQPKLEAAARLKFTLTPQEQADLRWYMEDYLHHPNVAPDEHIAQIEALMR